ncbi:MAG: DUF4430 domain-containing protein [Candidatus Thorarchaeota archaeon]
MSRVLLLVVLLLVVAPGQVVGTTALPQTQFTASATNISLQVDFGNGTVLNHQGLTGSDVLALTESVFSVEVSWYGNLAFLESIAGVANDQNEGRWWQYWVSGELGAVAANAYEVQDGDSVVWRYTSSQADNLEGKGPDSTVLLGAMILAGLGMGFLAILFIMRRRG